MSEEQKAKMEWEEICKDINDLENPLYKFIMTTLIRKLTGFIVLLENEDAERYAERINKDNVVAINILKKECEGKELSKIDYKKVYEEIDKSCCRFTSSVFKEAFLLDQ